MTTQESLTTSSVAAGQTKSSELIRQVRPNIETGGILGENILDFRFENILCFTCFHEPEDGEYYRHSHSVNIISLLCK